MIPINFIDELKRGMEIVEVNDERYLFTNMRIDRDTIPGYLYAYDVRDGDDCSGEFAEIKEFVLVNHWGTIIGNKPIPLDDGSYICTEDSDGNFISCAKLEDFLASKVDIQFINEGRIDETEFDTGDIDETKELWEDFAKENKLSPESITKVIFVFYDNSTISVEWKSDKSTTDFFNDIKIFMRGNYACNITLKKEEEDEPSLDMSLPFPWANYKISDEDLDRLIERQYDGEISVKSAFYNSVMTDMDDWFTGLIVDYKRSSAAIRSVIDATLVRVCGWSLPSLCRIAEEEVIYSDEFPRENQESVLDKMLGYLTEFTTFNVKESFGVNEDEDISQWSNEKLYSTLCDVGAYLYELWKDIYTDSEIKEKLISMGVPEFSEYMKDFCFEGK